MYCVIIMLRLTFCLRFGHLSALKATIFVENFTEFNSMLLLWSILFTSLNASATEKVKVMSTEVCSLSLLCSYGVVKCSHIYSKYVMWSYTPKYQTLSGMFPKSYSRVNLNHIKFTLLIRCNSQNFLP